MAELEQVEKYKIPKNLRGLLKAVKQFSALAESLGARWFLQAQQARYAQEDWLKATLLTQTLKSRLPLNLHELPGQEE